MNADRAAHSRHRLSSRTRIIAASIGVVVVCLLGAGFVRATESGSCTSCHDTPAFSAGTSASSHAPVECFACHQPATPAGRAVYAARWSAHSYLPRSRDVRRDDARVPDSRCKACHETALDGIVTSAGITIDHRSCTVGAACTDCHASVAHGPQAISWDRSYDMDACLGCHQAAGDVACDLCHERRALEARASSSAFEVSHAGTPVHGKGPAATCVVCHADAECATCHGAGVPHEARFLDAHSQYAAKPDARCETCHERRFCDSCHGTPMPHPASFTSTHPAESRKQPKLCERCHAAEDCSNCHIAHVHPGGAAEAAAGG